MIALLWYALAGEVVLAACVLRHPRKFRRYAEHARRKHGRTRTTNLEIVICIVWLVIAWPFVALAVLSPDDPA